MKINAAVLWERGAEWQIEDVELDEPKAHEVLVRMIASGLCHSDDHASHGDLPLQLPIIGGHEGAGVVEKVGSDVRGVVPGDHVVMAFLPSCGKCRWCSTGFTNLCDANATAMTGALLDGTYRAHARGKDIGAWGFLGTFGNYAVVPEDSVIKIDQDIPFEVACLVGCGVTTGWGSAVNTAEVSPGDTVVVVGIGGIGAGAIQGARIAGARYIVAVDTVPSKEVWARKFGATHFVTRVEHAGALVGELTRGVMADSSILAVGVATGDMVQPLLSLVRKGGRVVVAAITAADAMATEIQLTELTLFQKQLRGALYGEANPRADIPRLLGLYRSGLLLLDEMVTQRYKLSEVNQGYADMKSGNIIRGVIVHEH